MKKKFYKIVGVLLAISMNVSLSMPVLAQEESIDANSVKEGMHSENGISGLQEIDGQLYYFGADGTIQTGWIEINGNHFYFSLEDGHAYRDIIQNIDGTEYVFSPEGVASVIPKEEERDNNNLAIEDQEGDLEETKNEDIITDSIEQNTSEVKSDDIQENSNVPENKNEQKLKTVEDDIVVDKSENIETEDIVTPGWQSDNGILRYYSISGDYLTGKCEVDGDWYYFNANGEFLKNQWITDDNGKYYAMPDGKLRIGWLSFGSTYYYCNSNAEIVTGKLKIDGDWYYFNADGVRQQGQGN